MHIAICDDNIADRKQTERLMGREADKWIAAGDPMYVDSFGNAEALIKTPMLYDGFLIDICHTIGLSTMLVVKKLREKGVNAPIALCCSDVDYRKQDFPEDILFIDKPLKTAELHELLIRLKEIKTASAAQIELRGEQVTMYVSEPEILYAEQSGSYTKVILTEGRSQIIRDDAVILFDEIKRAHPTFVMTNLKTILNIRHITKIKFSNATMTDGNTFGIHSFAKDYAKEVLRRLSEGGDEALRELIK